MKRLDYKLEGDLLIKAFPKHRIDERRELLIILLEAIRYIFIADKIEEKAKATVSSQKMAIDCNLYLRCEQKF